MEFKLKIFYTGLKKRKLILVLGVGFAFLWIFTAFSTGSFASESVFEGSRLESKGEFNGSGYISLSILYIAFAIFNWFAPIIINIINPKFGMLFGSICYTVYLFSFIKPITWIIYMSSIAIGCGAALLWTSQGLYITMCSENDNIAKNFGYFWMLYQFSSVIGNVYTYLQFSNLTLITTGVRIPMYSVLISLSFVGNFLLIILPMPCSESNLDAIDLRSGDIEIAEIANNKNSYPLKAAHKRIYLVVVHSLTKSFSLLKSKIMLTILLTSAYTGFSLSFTTSVYGTSLSHINKFGNSAKSYIGLAGIFVGLGSMFGGQLNLWLRPPVSNMLIFLGAASGLLYQSLSFLFLPGEASFKATDNVGYIAPNVYLAMFIAFLCGTNDSIWNTQISALLGKAYPPSSENTAIAFSLYKFVQSLTAAIAFYYSTALILQWQIVVICIFLSLGLFGFIYAQHKCSSHQKFEENVSNDCIRQNF